MNKEKSRIVQNVFSENEIAQLVNYYSNQPYTIDDRFTKDNKLKYRNKNNGYDDKDSLPYEIIHSKLVNILGEHNMQYGAYLESHYPFGVHVDTNTHIDETQDVYHHKTDIHRNIAVIIPLCESSYFKTIFFDYFINSFDDDTTLPKLLKEPQDLDIDLDHLGTIVKEKMQWIPIDQIFHWKIGDIAIWNRNQLHCASNFLPSNTFKTAVTLFL
jgi:hypothetical protein